ncbi:TPA: hypothetical protein EYN98_22180 [Candidatus Poribacteria bacterium]|nr:hypothetical protein [Candidatus Poribacteria bacterium]
MFIPACLVLSTRPHQDAGYYFPDGDQTLIVACLIPLVDTTVDNGCLWVALRRHHEGVFRHVWAEDGLNLLVEDIPLPERIPVPQPRIRPSAVAETTALHDFGHFRRSRMFLREDKIKLIRRLTAKLNLFFLLLK